MNAAMPSAAQQLLNASVAAQEYASAGDVEEADTQCRTIVDEAHSVVDHPKLVATALLPAEARGC